MGVLVTQPNKRQPRNRTNEVGHKQVPQQTGDAKAALSDLFKKRTAAHKPIVKALEELGIKVRVMPVMIGDEPVDCLVIPTQELVIKEYQLLTGVDPNMLLQPEGKQNGE